MVINLTSEQVQLSNSHEVRKIMNGKFRHYENFKNIFILPMKRGSKIKENIMQIVVTADVINNSGWSDRSNLITRLARSLI